MHLDYILVEEEQTLIGETKIKILDSVFIWIMVSELERNRR